MQAFESARQSINNNDFRDPGAIMDGLFAGQQDFEQNALGHQTVTTVRDILASGTGTYSPSSTFPA